MKTCFTAVVLAFASCVSYAGESVGEPQSVLVEKPTVVASAAPACANGQCGRLYNVESSAASSRRNRLFGGYVVRQNSRTVYRPAPRR